MNASSRLALPAPWLAQLTAARARWRGFSARDRRMVWLAVVILGAFALWALAIQPAWRTLRAAPTQLDALDAQLQEMRLLATEAQALREAPALSADQSALALKAASERLGNRARLSLQGQRAVLTLSGVSSMQLRAWLTEARAGARARPVEAQLTRNAQGFSGSVVLSIGGAQ